MTTYSNPRLDIMIIFNHVERIQINSQNLQILSQKLNIDEQIIKNHITSLLAIKWIIYYNLDSVEFLQIQRPLSPHILKCLKEHKLTSDMTEDSNCKIISHNNRGKLTLENRTTHSHKSNNSNNSNNKRIETSQKKKNKKHKNKNKNKYKKKKKKKKSAYNKKKLLKGYKIFLLGRFYVNNTRYTHKDIKEKLIKPYGGAVVTNYKQSNLLIYDKEKYNQNLLSKQVNYFIRHKGKIGSYKILQELENNNIKNNVEELIHIHKVMVCNAPHNDIFDSDTDLDSDNEPKQFKCPSLPEKIMNSTPYLHEQIALFKTQEINKKISYLKIELNKLKQSNKKKRDIVMQMGKQLQSIQDNIAIENSYYTLFEEKNEIEKYSSESNQNLWTIYNFIEHIIERKILHYTRLTNGSENDLKRLKDIHEKQIELKKNKLKMEIETKQILQTLNSNLYSYKSKRYQKEKEILQNNLIQLVKRNNILNETINKKQKDLNIQNKIYKLETNNAKLTNEVNELKMQFNQTIITNNNNYLQKKWKMWNNLMIRLRTVGVTCKGYDINFSKNIKRILPNIAIFFQTLTIKKNELIIKNKKLEYDMEQKKLQKKILYYKQKISKCTHYEWLEPLYQCKYSKDLICNSLLLNTKNNCIELKILDIIIIGNDNQNEYRQIVKMYERNNEAYVTMKELLFVQDLHKLSKVEILNINQYNGKELVSTERKFDTMIQEIYGDYNNIITKPNTRCVLYLKKRPNNKLEIRRIHKKSTTRQSMRQKGYVIVEK